MSYKWSNFRKKTLKECIAMMAELGFTLSVCDLGEPVELFVSFNELEDAKLQLKFKGRQGHPGPDWISSIWKETICHWTTLQNLVECVTMLQKIHLSYTIFTTFWGTPWKTLELKIGLIFFGNVTSQVYPMNQKSARLYLKRDKRCYK